jgi:hypothetical protein
MKIEQKYWTKEKGWVDHSSTLGKETPQLVLVFGGRAVLENSSHYEELGEMYPDSHILMSSTAGEIIDTTVLDDSLVLSAINFEKTKLEFSKTEINKADESEAKGAELARSTAQAWSRD